MPPYEQLHAFNAALFAPGRIARGVGFHNRRMFSICLDRTLSAVSELEYRLTVARASPILAIMTIGD